MLRHPERGWATSPLPVGVREGRIGGMTAARMRVVILAALVCGAGVVALVLASDREERHGGVGDLRACRGVELRRHGPLRLAAAAREPHRNADGGCWASPGAWPPSPSRTRRLVYSFALVAGGLWGGVFLHLVMAFPSGRLSPGRDRAIVVAGYLIFTLASIPSMLFGGPQELGVRRLPGERAADPARPGSRDRRSRPSRRALRRAVRDRARSAHSALAANACSSNGFSSLRCTSVGCSRSCS